MKLINILDHTWISCYYFHHIPREEQENDMAHESNVVIYIYGESRLNLSIKWRINGKSEVVTFLEVF